jgi:hypothetical protein
MTWLATMEESGGHVHDLISRYGISVSLKTMALFRLK